jgi:hypothetical protein
MESGNTELFEASRTSKHNATSRSLPASSYEQPDGLQYEYKKQDYKYRSKCNQECFLSICQEFSPKN